MLKVIMPIWYLKISIKCAAIISFFISDVRGKLLKNWEGSIIYLKNSGLGGGVDGNWKQHS
ncbi:hypothetical protein Pint_15558 [Pistacia integerrima]|uniref:Uncharacterized protein n=1 Tax=Pistacia integerrima TaxID=434235 RepID=A0ACC0ZEY6_9ROSI|nr:hypothetical protein Pint_15558 [Pistacia integerrima]